MCPHKQTNKRTHTHTHLLYCLVNFSRNSLCAAKIFENNLFYWIIDVYWQAHTNATIPLLTVPVQRCRVRRCCVQLPYEILSLRFNLKFIYLFIFLRIFRSKFALHFEWVLKMDCFKSIYEFILIKITHSTSLVSHWKCCESGALHSFAYTVVLDGCSTFRRRQMEWCEWVIWLWWPFPGGKSFMSLNLCIEIPSKSKSIYAFIFVFRSLCEKRIRIVSN